MPKKQVRILRKAKYTLLTGIYNVRSAYSYKRKKPIL